MARRLGKGHWEESSVWFNRQGEPIDVEQWTTLHSDPEYRRVAETTIGPLWVSTVWLGIDHGFGMSDRPDRPVIFETMIFPADETYWQRITSRVGARYDDSALHVELRELVESQWRYVTEQQAIAGHDSICVDVRNLISNIEMAEQVMREAIENAQHES